MHVNKIFIVNHRMHYNIHCGDFGMHDVATHVMYLELAHQLSELRSSRLNARRYTPMQLYTRTYPKVKFNRYATNLLYVKGAWKPTRDIS